MVEQTNSQGLDKVIHVYLSTLLNSVLTKAIQMKFFQDIKDESDRLNQSILEKIFNNITTY